MKIREGGLASVFRMAKILALWTAILFFIALANLAARPQAASQDPAIERGHNQYEETCAFCHGADATGARGPDLVRSPLVAHDVKGDLIGEVIRHGRPDKGMPAMALTDEQVSDLAAYLHARAAEALNSAGLPRVYPAEKLLTGSVEAGKAYFNGAGGCNKCHSPTGDMSAAARKYSPIDLEAQMLYPEGRHTIASVTLASGEHLKGALLHLNDFEIALRDGSGWYRSFSRERAKIELQDPLDAHRDLLPKLTQADVHNLFAYLESLK
ncbi:MAG: cytochrome c [Candidatus Acidiferrum sp.]